jgi:hypothetical protein
LGSGASPREIPDCRHEAVDIRDPDVALRVVKETRPNLIIRTAAQLSHARAEHAGGSPPVLSRGVFHPYVHKQGVGDRPNLIQLKGARHAVGICRPSLRRRNFNEFLDRSEQA